MLNRLRFPSQLHLLRRSVPWKVLQGALAVCPVPCAPLTALEAACPKLTSHPPIRPLGLPLQVSSWNLPSLHFYPRRPWGTREERASPFQTHFIFCCSILREGQEREAAMVPHTLLSSSDFYKFFLTKTFMVKEAVHKQAYSWLVKD